MSMSYTLTLDIPEDVYEPLKRTAEQSGQSPEVLAVQWLTTAVQHLVEDPLEKFIGAFNSQGSDWADHHDQHLGQSVAETMRNTPSEGHLDG
jgi:hypothetical protein